MDTKTRKLLSVNGVRHVRSSKSSQSSQSSKSSASVGQFLSYFLLRTDIGSEIELRSHKFCIRHREFSLHLKISILTNSHSLSIIQKDIYLGLQGPVSLGNGNGANKSKEQRKLHLVTTSSPLLTSLEQQPPAISCLCLLGRHSADVWSVKIKRHQKSSVLFHSVVFVLSNVITGSFCFVLLDTPLFQCNLKIQT